jgi:hypothetical protein
LVDAMIFLRFLRRSGTEKVAPYQDVPFSARIMLEQSGIFMGNSKMLAELID